MMGDFEMAQRLPTERIGLATWWFAQGHAFTVRELAERLEMSPRGCRMLLERLSLAVPLTVDEGEDGGVWRICGSDGRFDDEP